MRYNDGLHNGSRRPTLWLVVSGEIVKFEGNHIPGTVAIAQEKWSKNGKWSNTEYVLELGQNVTPCYLLAPLHGQVWPENNRFLAYTRFCEDFGVAVSFEKFDTALLRDFPRSRERMLLAEAVSEGLSETAGHE